jgi:hypothetical protein
LTPTAETTTRIYPSETALSTQTTPGGTHPAEPTPENLGLPEGVSLYPGAYDFFWVPGMGAPMVCYAVDETPEKVQKFYENDLALHGWSLLNTEPTKPGTLSQNWRKGGVTLNVMLLSGITDDPNGTYVSLTWP